jgi:gluconolactonase
MKFLFVFTAVVCLAQPNVQPRPFELKAESPKFWDLIARDAKMDKVAGGFGFTEGPMWDEKGFLYVSDEKQNKVSRVYPDGKVETVVSLGDPDGSTFDKNHHLINCATVLRAVIEIAPDGTYKVLADKYEGKRFNSPNDVVLGPDGALYFTDPGDVPRGQTRELQNQGVYRLAEDGSVQLVVDGLVEPNGLAFSPDGKRLYVDDSRQRDIHLYDFAGGKATNGRVFGKEEGREGVPDGMRVDMQGNLYVTGPLGIWVWDPDGNHVGTIIVPETPANLAWGDKDYKTLYIAGKSSVYRMRTNVRGFVADRPVR